MSTLKELLCLLEERLVQHDENRKEVQRELQEICTKIKRGVDPLEEKVSEDICKAFNKTEERISNLIVKLNERIEHPETSKGDISALIRQARQFLSSERSYEIEHSEKAKSFAGSYKLKVSSTKVKKEFDFDNTTDEASKVELITAQLQECLNKFQESKMYVQDKLVEICNKKRREADGLETRVNGELEELFSREDARLQEAVKILKKNMENENPTDAKKLAKIAKTALINNQIYSLNEGDSCDKCKISVKKEISIKFVNFEKRKPTGFAARFTNKGELSISFSFFSEDEGDILKELNIPFRVVMNMWEKDRGEADIRSFTRNYVPGKDESIYFRSTFTASATYRLKMRIVHQEMRTQWSDEAEFTTPEFEECCVWKECPDDAYVNRKYSVDERSPRIATRIGGDGYCTIIGNTALPPNKVTSWSIKILKSQGNDGRGIFIGVVQSVMDQNESWDYKKCGWYLNCVDLSLCSGPPRNYKVRDENYGPRKEEGEYVHTGDSVGVVMDTAKGELSFVVSGVNLGVAFKKIPLDEPLVPCVLLFWQSDSVELDTSEVKENAVDNSIPVPSNVRAKSTTWDSIALTWDAVEGASFYQIEVDENKFWYTSPSNEFTKRGLPPETERSFKVRAVRGNSVSEWSDVVKGRAQKELFEYSGWKACPAIYYGMRYSVDERNSRVARKKGGKTLINGRCTIIGNTPLPLNQMTSWSIKILESWDNNGSGIWIGVAPSDISQSKDDNRNKCGWYFECYESILWSGSPHNYRGKEYGPRKGNGKYVHTGDSVGVVMDTAKGELSFILNGVNLGVAFEGIPLDKPLVPCVILEEQNDSVELII